MARPVNVGDVQQGVTAHWAATPALSGLVPAARVLPGAAPKENPQRPYARFVLRASDPERTSGPAFLQRFALAVAVYTTADKGQTTVDEVMAALDAGFAGTDRDPAAGLAVPNAAVVHCRATAGDGPATNRGDLVHGDLIQVRKAYDLLLESWWR